MACPALYKFEVDGKYFAVDTETCFCFECDRISWDVLDYYPHESINRIYFLLKDIHPRKEVEEVVGELEWLRATKAILKRHNDKALLGKISQISGLKRIVLQLDTSGRGLEWVSTVGTFLLARSGDETHLTVSVRGERSDFAQMAPHLNGLEKIFIAARLAGKKFSVELDFPIHPVEKSEEGSSGCIFRCRILLSDYSDLLALSESIATWPEKKIKEIAKEPQKWPRIDYCCIVAQPISERCGMALQVLGAAGYTTSVIDLPMAWMMCPSTDPYALVDALKTNGTYYVEALKRRKSFLAEPFASLFHSIQEGIPCLRYDDSGTGTLAVDAQGKLYPSICFLGMEQFVWGNLSSGSFNESCQEMFRGLGVFQNPVCIECWARGFCGGGHSAIHYVRSNNVSKPEKNWCDAQRQWITHAVALFNQVSSSNIKFADIISGTLPAPEKLSFLTVMKAIFTGRYSVRPLKEEDAPWLVQWQNWNRAGYFVCNETGMLLGTQYDREMDALHPLPFESELVLTQSNGNPCGLIKLRPIVEKRLVWAWIYLHKTALDHPSVAIGTLRQLLKEFTLSQPSFPILCPVTQEEIALKRIMVAAGFQHVGIQRKALYQKGGYHDVDILLFKP